MFTGQSENIFCLFPDVLIFSQQPATSGQQLKKIFWCLLRKPP